MTVIDGLLCLTTLVPLVTAASLCWMEEVDDEGRNFVPDNNSYNNNNDNTSPRYNITTRRQRNRTNNNNNRRMRRYQLDLSIVLKALQRLQSFLYACIEFLSETHIRPATVYRISSIALSTTMVYSKLCLLLHEMGVPLMDLRISMHVFWMIPLSTVVCALCSAIIVWTKWNPSHIVILCGLVTLFFVECLFPVTVTISMALCLFEMISIIDAVILSLSMFVVGSVNSKCIRAVIYPSLGLG